MAAATEVSLLIVDVQLPGMSGRAVADALTKSQPTARVLFISGGDWTTLVSSGLLLHSAAFLSKPFLPLELAQQVREVLDEALAQSSVSSAG